MTSKESHMRTAQQGDQVSVHFVKRAPNGAVSSSRGGGPLELTVGKEHRRLPGLGLALVGLGEGERVKVLVPADPTAGKGRGELLKHLNRSRFSKAQELAIGGWVRVAGRSGRRHLVQIVEVRDDVVVVDVNRPWLGQAVALEV